jgi:hypothetical protein
MNAARPLRSLPRAPTRGRSLVQGLAELGPFAPSEPAQAGSEPRRSPLGGERGHEQSGGLFVPASARSAQGAP